MLSKYMNSLSLDLRIQFTYSSIINLCCIVLQKKEILVHVFYRAQKQLTKFSKIKIIHTPGKNLSVADMLSRSLTKTELQLNQLKHKQLTPQLDFAILQKNS